MTRLERAAGCAARSGAGRAAGVLVGLLALLALAVVIALPGSRTFFDAVEVVPVGPPLR